MDIKFQNSKAVSINFTNRKLRNKSEKNWNESIEQRMFLEKKESYIDGANSDVVVMCQTVPFLKEMVTNGKLSTREILYPIKTDPEIESLLETQEKILLKGKTVQESSFIELLQSGILKL